MFERYTEKARRVIFFARYEASLFGSPVIEPEHLLLGLLREAPDLSEYLGGLRVDVARRYLEEMAPPQKEIPTSVDMPMSLTGRRALAFAAEESERLARKHIDPSLLLLGLFREPAPLVTSIFERAGITVDINELRDKIAREAPKVESVSPSRDFVARNDVRHFTAHVEDGATVVETRHIHHGHEINIVERLRLSEDRKTLHYSQEITGPGRSAKHEVDFNLSSG